MRVLNDREEKSQPSQSSDFGFLSLLSCVLLTAVGVATLILSPLPIILNHTRLLDPWPKVATLLGAVVALLFLEVPLAPVLIAFSFGLFVADGVDKKVPFLRLLGSSTLFALAMGFFSLSVMASIEKTSLAVFWVGLIDHLILQTKSAFTTIPSLEWNNLRELLLFQGPFLYVSVVILSFWFSIGIAAHMQWLKEKSACEARALRKIEFPGWLSIAFIFFFFLSIFSKVEVQQASAGVVRILASFMFIQGVITLSRLMELKRVRHSTRTIIYSSFLLLGFYMLVGVGVFSPWILRKKQVGPGKGVLAHTIEEAI